MAEPTELLRMEGVRKRFGAPIALDGVDQTVHAGEGLALVGEYGAGKSPLMKTLSGARARRGLHARLVRYRNERELT